MANTASPAGEPVNSMLLWLGRILPREFVDQVAEPALSDEEHHWSERGRMPLLGRTRFVFSCLLIGMPQFFWARRRPTRMTVFLAASALMVLIALVLLAPSLYEAGAP